MKVCRKGFTLQECLVVVSLVFVMGAVLVPNYMQASTREKVARSYAHMREIGLALEAYRLDQKAYPFSISRGFSSRYASLLPRLIHLSTPVAYIENIPEDHFAFQGIEEGYISTNPYMIPYGGSLVRPYPYGFNSFEKFTENAYMRFYITKEGHKMLWVTRGVGPDLYRNILGTATNRTVGYDPTNGTISNGDLYFAGPDIGITSPVHEKTKIRKQ